MSFRRNNNRKRYRDDDFDDRIGREVYELPEDTLKNALIAFGDVEFEGELPRMAKRLKEEQPSSLPGISEGFRIGVTEEPFKIPHYATLMRALHSDDSDAATDSIGRTLMDDFWKAFQAYLDKLAWREVRLCVQFFGHLTAAHVVSPQSMLTLLQSFIAVLEEFGVSHERAQNAALCAAEGLLSSGALLKKMAPDEVTALITGIQTYAESTTGSKTIVYPLANPDGDVGAFEGTEEVLDNVITFLKALDASEFDDVKDSIPQPYLRISEYQEPLLTYFELPTILVPPEAIEMDSMVAEGDEGSETTTPAQKKEAWPVYQLRLFDNTVTADPGMAKGYAVRRDLSDIIDIFEVNRKECARFLLEFPKWTLPGTFKARAGGPQAPQPSDEEPQGWQLESCLLEVILSKMLVLPESKHTPLYYVTLIAELCKLSPPTVGPALGKSIRKLYSLLGAGLDVEIARRFVDWFAIHMSNFGFTWVWKEWILDLSETPHHPKRNFIRRAIEVEIRLAYHDRIVKTLPEPFHAAEVGVVPEQAPGPEYDYDDPAHPYYQTAQSILTLLRGREKAERIVSQVDELKTSMSEVYDSDTNTDSLLRAITVQSLLHVGSRSFSHFLNAIERYLPLLRSLSTDPTAKGDILNAAAGFWRRNKHMTMIVFDKLMQYQIVDPSDVVGWAFRGQRNGGTSTLGMIDVFRWELIRGALDKANGRVTIAKKKVTTLRKEQDDDRAQAKARTAAMEVDADGAPEETPANDSPALTTALKAYAVLTREQKTVLSRTLTEFATNLTATGSILKEGAWHNRANWNDEEWDIWETWGHYRHFCRAYASYLRSYATTLSTVAFAEIQAADERATALLKKTWNIALGQEP